MRAYLTTARGSCTVRTQQVASATATPGANWTNIVTGASYGATTITTIGNQATLAGAVRFETAERPGADLGSGVFAPSRHLMTFASYYYSTASNWNYVQNGPDLGLTIVPGGPQSHRRHVADTAEWTGTGATIGLNSNTFVVVGPNSAYSAGPFRFIRNDWVNGLNDWDGDELGADLEYALKTFDSTASPAWGGWLPTAHPGCGTPYNDALCKGSLRDSDWDGLRDDVELYGVSESTLSYKTKGYMARYGANPAHYDMFVEVDRGLDPTVPPSTTCTSAAALQYTQPQITGTSDIWANEQQIINNDGVYGISLHFDIGAKSSLITETRFGDWNGSNTVCDYDSSGTKGHAYTNGMPLQRRWLFHEAWQLPPTQQGTGGGTSVLSPFSAVDGYTSIGHELGHQCGLNHYGPAFARDWQANFKPHHYSRIDYEYQVYGALGGAWGGAYTSVNFSSGRHYALNLYAPSLSERCPFGPGGDPTTYLAATVNYAGWNTGSTTYPDCADGSSQPRIDWNQDGQYSTTPVAGPVLLDSQVTYRARGSNNRLFSPNSMTQAGVSIATNANRLAYARITTRDVPTSGSVVLVEINNGITCNQSTPVPGTGDGWPACWNADLGADDGQIYLTAGSAPGFADGLDIEGAYMGGRLDPNVFVVVWERFGAVEWGIVSFDAFGNPGWEFEGAVPGATVLPGPTPSAEANLPALALVDPTTIMLTYRNVAGTITYQLGTVTSTSVTWSAASTVTISGAAVACDLGSPGLGQLSGTYGSGVVMAVPRTSSVTGLPEIHLYKYAAGWTDVGTFGMGSAPGAASVRGRPSIAAVPSSPGTRLHLVYTSSGLAGTPTYGTTWMTFSGFGSFSSWRGPYDFGGGLFNASTPPLVWDARTTVSPAALRSIESQIQTCTSTSTCPGGWTCTTAPIGPNRCVSPSGTIMEQTDSLLPFADGAVPMVLSDNDESQTLRYGACLSLRQCGGSSPACFPTQFRDLDGTGMLPEATCAAAPTGP